MGGHISIQILTYTLKQEYLLNRHGHKSLEVTRWTNCEQYCSDAVTVLSSFPADTEAARNWQSFHMTSHLHAELLHTGQAVLRSHHCLTSQTHQFNCHLPVNLRSFSGKHQKYKKHTNSLFVKLTFYSIFLWNYVRLRLSRSKKTFRQNLCGIIVTVSSCPNNSIKKHWKALLPTRKNQLVLFYSPTVVTPDWKDATPIILALSYIDK